MNEGIRSVVLNLFSPSAPFRRFSEVSLVCRPHVLCRPHAHIIKYSGDAMGGGGGGGVAFRKCKNILCHDQYINVLCTSV